jgi:hypothetical protein
MIISHRLLLLASAIALPAVGCATSPSDSGDCATTGHCDTALDPLVEDAFLDGVIFADFGFDPATPGQPACLRPDPFGAKWVKAIADNCREPQWDLTNCPNGELACIVPLSGTAFPGKTNSNGSLDLRQLCRNPRPGSESAVVLDQPVSSAAEYDDACGTGFQRKFELVAKGFFSFDPADVSATFTPNGNVFDGPRIDFTRQADKPGTDPGPMLEINNTDTGWSEILMHGNDSNGVQRTACLVTGDTAGDTNLYAILRSDASPRQCAVWIPRRKGPVASDRLLLELGSLRGKCIGLRGDRVTYDEQACEEGFVLLPKI